MHLRTTDELWCAFELHRNAIEVSSLAFDGGLKGEAIRLANSIFILIGEKMKNHLSICDQIGIKDRLLFPTTIPVGDTSESPLYSAFVKIWDGNLNIELMPLGFGATMTGRQLKFDDWWQETVLGPTTGQSLTRGAIIRSMRDQDGGAHYDARVTDSAYAAAIRGELTGFAIQDPKTGQKIPVKYALETTMRQIAEEVRIALKYVAKQ